MALCSIIVAFRKSVILAIGLMLLGCGSAPSYYDGANQQGEPSVTTLSRALSASLGSGIYVGRIRRLAYESSSEAGRLQGNQAEVLIEEELLAGHWDHDSPWSVGSVQGAGDGSSRQQTICAGGDPQAGQRVLLFPWFNPWETTHSALGTPVKASALGPHLICISDNDDVVFDSFENGQGLAERTQVPLALVRAAIISLTTPGSVEKRLEIQSTCQTLQCAEGTMCFFGVGCANTSLATGVQMNVYDGWQFRPDGFSIASSTNP